MNVDSLSFAPISCSDERGHVGSWKKRGEVVGPSAALTCSTIRSSNSETRRRMPSRELAGRGREGGRDPGRRTDG
ncbi:hypothetical protein MPTK1_7g00910 [Marchantia polymorpha subsp. ruderalis]|uniref:Uncharacterized protein n=2 Tax=Marchantia polymorpha TaxID=3197 RepID=A0AAF6BUW1_MARPO|nr:hypothetical protein MARPO_0046s0033 [Marchantia polymorpha]BBN15795.1 hypothetical protein Mp_7g00910 [Marchantia polymorpha subsp. ruderalis]|eukprot:PTQ39211.1 hypothetical protein MARPO_0046s0033 [Marchantia polymorpha]